MNTSSLKSETKSQIAPEAFSSAGDKASISAPLSLRDFVHENESENQSSTTELFLDKNSREFKTELEILKGHMALLDQLSKKKSFLLREVKYLLKV